VLYVNHNKYIKVEEDRFNSFIDGYRPNIITGPNGAPEIEVIDIVHISNNRAYYGADKPGVIPWVLMSIKIPNRVYIITDGDKWAYVRLSIFGLLLPDNVDIELNQKDRAIIIGEMLQFSDSVLAI